jgi:hypothetical protein
MVNKVLLGTSLIVISIILSAFSLTFRITGAVTGVSPVKSFLMVITMVFFLSGLIIVFISKKNLEKNLIKFGLTAALLAGGVTAAHKKIENNRELQITSFPTTIEGRFERTYRYDKILDDVEKKYHLPRGILKGLAMRESNGDPTKLNSTGDGGAGLYMFQPGIAQYYGLKTYGASQKKSVDSKHGRELRELKEKFESNYEELAKVDERFDVWKASDAAARFLVDLHKWDDVLSAYNEGQPAEKASKTEHVKKINEFRKYYKKRDHFWVNQSKYKERHPQKEEDKKK